MAARERKLARKEEVTREHDKIIGEIEQSDQTCLGTAMKNVYTLGHVGRFQKKLDKRIRLAVESCLVEITFFELELSFNHNKGIMNAKSNACVTSTTPTLCRQLKS